MLLRSRTRRPAGFIEPSLPSPEKSAAFGPRLASVMARRDAAAVRLLC